MSIRWKLAGTYLVVIAGTLFLVNWLVLDSLETYYLQAREKNYLAHANIIAGSGREVLLSGDRNSFYMARSYGQTIDARVLLLNAGGKVLMDSFGETWLEGKTLRHEEVVAALAGNSGTGLHVLQDEKKVLYIAVPVVGDKKVLGAVMLVTGVGDIYANLANVRERLLVLSALSGVAAFMLGLYLAGVLARPVRELTAGVEEMTAGRFGVRVPVRGQDELGRLATSFNVMSTKLDKVERMRREFVANASHEMKSPLSSMKVLAQSLIESNEEDPAVYREFLQDIDTEIDRLSRLAEKLLYLARLEEGEVLRRKNKPVLPLVKRVLAVMRPQVEAKGVQVAVDVGQELKWPIDDDMLVQLVFNLVDNAIKYCPAKGGKVEIAARIEEGQLIIRVQDNGPGIPYQDQPHLFERFYRVDKARSRQTGGTGLGLAIVQQIARLHGGDATVQSTPGKTVFEVRLPGDDGS